MNDNQVFGVKDPATGEVAWCAVLGMRGEVFGLAAYLGTAGLDIHRGIQSGKLGPDSDEIRFGFPCLLTSFENRQELEASDLSLIRSLGLIFRGRNTWPQFRSHRRGWYPWHLDGSEVAFLTDVIQQAVVVCARLRSEQGLLGRANAPERFVRAIGESGSWGDSGMRPAPPVAARYPASIVDEQETAGLKGTRSSREGTWEVDLFYVPTPTRENRDERPYYPVAMVWADQRSGMVLGIDLLSQADDPDQKVTALAEKLLVLAKEHSRIPQAIHVPRPALAAALSRAAGLLECELVVSRRLPALEEVKEHLLERFAGP
ncbi:MAG: hypothetical protein IMZ69_03030 [Spirochaetes bacterium]|nr:hypothetical protein [Spirochaetota bacterium]